MCVCVCVCVCVHLWLTTSLFNAPFFTFQMSISVEGHILVFDEGHNMEDAAREAASYTLTNHDLLDVLADIDRVKELLGAVGEARGEEGREGEGREGKGRGEHT